jgi:hypothetical protein
MISHAKNPCVLSLARDIYAVYCASSDGKNYQGLPCPAWDALTDAVRGHWYTVALRVFTMSEFIRGTEPMAVPNSYVLGHLPNEQHAYEVWCKYSVAQ